MAQAPRSRTATIRAVAELAGVSVSTVSRVMNGKATVDPAIAVRVRAAAHELGYTPNPLARPLVLGRTTTVAILVPDLGNPTFQSMMRGVSRAAARDGFRVLVADSAEDVREEGVLAVEMRRRSDAIVLCAPRMPDDLLQELLPQLEPVVLVNRLDASAEPRRCRPTTRRASGPSSSTSRDSATGGSPSCRAPPRAPRTRRGCGGSARSPGRTPGSGSTSSTAGPRSPTATRPRRRSQDPVTRRRSASTTSSPWASSAALAELGVRVPDDVSVTGFDDIPFARYTTPPLTTASVPVEELGEEAWRRLRAMIAGDAPAPDARFRPSLEVRRSTSGPRAEAGTT